MAIEVDPRVTSQEHLDRLVELGFNRLSMGVQDLTPEVQKAITRDQTYEQTAELMEYARRVGFAEGINLDLIYGLPEQKLETFETNLDQILGLRPDRVAVYSFAYVPWIRGHQKKLDQDTLPSADLKLRALSHGHGALPGRRLRPHRHGPLRPARATSWRWRPGKDACTGTSWATA